MKRAYMIEMGIFRDYALYLLIIGFFLTVIVGVGMQTAIVAPAILTCMYFMMGAMGAAAYDDQNGWGKYRLTLPISRRDVVLGRYAAIVTLGLTGTVIGLIVSLGVMLLAATFELPGGISDSLAITGNRVLGMGFATAVCLLIGSVVAAIVSPVYFKFGQTKATQILPTIIVVLFVVPFIILGNSGIFDEGIDFGMVTDFLMFVDDPVGLGIAIAAVVVLSFLLLVVSAAVSLRIYTGRDL